MTLKAVQNPVQNTIAVFKASLYGWEDVRDGVMVGERESTNVIVLYFAHFLYTA